MDSPAILWGLTVVAAAIVICQVWWLQSRSVNIDKATEVLIKILSAGNRERAMRLTNAAPQAVYMRAVHHALGGDSTTREAVQSRFDSALADGLRPFPAMTNAGYVAVLAGGLAAGLAATSSSPNVAVIATSIAAVIVALRNVKQLGAIEAQARAGFARVVDVLVAVPAAAPAAAPVATSTAAPTAAPAATPARSPHDLVLVASIDGREVARRKLDEKVIKIGKMASSHLFIDHPSMSRIHAVVEVTDEHAQIIDLGSTTGTKVNGDRVNKATVTAGDVLQLGDVHIELIG
jgi:hypothetical protein